jgi:lipopolysaccharide/colanic/teichoic acid biosynthesis glycosyltransferase
MRVDAEASGPALSSDDDPRITPIGRFLRKTHLDEIPQFWMVLRGDMSLVGPRPERAHFIAQIEAQAPEYRQLLKVRPGITSWGQVKYGYASTVEEMLQRLKYDLLYLENMSLALDFKILAYTLLRVVQRDGK